MTFEDLKSLKVWVTWHPVRKLDGSIAKVPDQTCNQPDTWMPYDEALALARKKGLSYTNDGREFPCTGIQLGPESGISCIDMDWKDQPTTPFEEIPDYAQEIISQQDSVCEWSVSGRGVHTFVQGIPKNDPSFAEGVELYCDNRFIAVTEQWVEGTSAEIAQYKLIPRPEPPVLPDGKCQPEQRRIKKGQVDNFVQSQLGKFWNAGLRSEDGLFNAVMEVVRNQVEPEALDANLEPKLREKIQRQSKQWQDKGPRVPECFKIRRGDQINREPVLWTWKPVLQKGALIVFAGESSQGKSPVVTDLAARITSGKPWPDGTPNTAGPRDVIYMGLEDRAEDTVMPRFDAAGGDANRIHLVEGVRYEDKNGTELERMVALDRDIGKLKELANNLPELSVIFIDPITNYLGSVKMNREEEVRQILMPLAKLAQERSFTIVAVCHFNKNTESRNPLDRISGARAFAGVSRGVFTFGQDPDVVSKYCHVMAPARGAVESGSFKYSTSVNEQDTVIVTWGGRSDATAEDLVQPSTLEERSGVAKAAEALTQYLIDNGGKALATDCRRHLAEEGLISLDSAKGTVDKVSSRIRQKAGVQSVPAKNFKMTGRGHVWYIPAKFGQESLWAERKDSVSDLRVMENRL